MYTATFIAENVRAGILGVGKGQKEAAASIGLNKNQILKLVVMPQALRIIICLLYTSPSPRDGLLSRMPSSA